MTPPRNTPDTPQPTWRTLARQRWPLIGAALLVLVLGAWIYSRRADADQGAGAQQASPTKRETVSTDSVVTLDSASLRLAGIVLVVAAPVDAGALVANGTITYDANYVSVVAPRAEGRVTTVRADLGQSVRAGTVLATLESSEIGQTRGDIARTRAMLEVAKLNFERERRLLEQSVTSQKQMLEAQAAYRSVEADYNAAVSKLRSLGAEEGAGGTYDLVTPVAGTVVERNAMPGQIAGPATNLFTVAELHHVWITVEVYESDASRVREGTVALVAPRSLRGEVFRGRVTYAGGVVDTLTHTVKIRVAVANRGLKLRPGMYAEVQLETPVAVLRNAQGASVAVPDAAVQDVNGKSVVFVPGASPGQFIARVVRLAGPSNSGTVTVTAGLQPGDKVVSTGAFQLKAELTKSSFGESER